MRRSTRETRPALRPRRSRFLPVLAMFLGALVGALLLKAGLALVLGAALALIGTAAVILWRLSAPGVAWAKPL